ncbi:MAG: YbbR-like domain-containing protein, partial [Clostridiaceae bacterium]|nr:YbbR-like domain-containing protein [Clostridiaceae bacterium]
HYGADRAAANGFGIQGYPVTNVQITLRGRQQVLADITAGRISAYIDVSEVARTGPVQLPVNIDTNTLLYTKTELLFPATVTVNIFGQE